VVRKTPSGNRNSSSLSLRCEPRSFDNFSIICEQTEEKIKGKTQSRNKTNKLLMNSFDLWLLQQTIINYIVVSVILSGLLFAQMKRKLQQWEGVRRGNKWLELSLKQMERGWNPPSKCEITRKGQKFASIFLDPTQKPITTSITTRQKTGGSWKWQLT
jgi:hypothetical protein